MGVRYSQSSKAKHKGAAKKRRRRRAERREATREVREAYNEKMRAEGHPGWVARPSRRHYIFTDWW